MKTVAAVLKEARLQKNLTLQQATQATKIPLGALEKIEAGDYWSLPGETYVKGFLKNYARFLGVDSEKILAFFRREYKKPIKKKGRLAWLPVGTKSITITPRAVVVTLGTVLILGFLTFLVWQYKNFAGAPLLVVLEPADQQRLVRPMVTVVGKSDPDASVLVNGEVISLDEKGNFQKTIDLDQGVHVITITATNKLGKETIVKRTVAVKSPRREP